MKNWIPLTTEEQLTAIAESTSYTFIYKHSTRCPVSSMVKKNVTLDEILIPEHVVCYYLDLIAYRPVSNRIAEQWQVRHESPQLLLLRGADCIYHASHHDIQMADFVQRIGTI